MQDVVAGLTLARVRTAISVPSSDAQDARVAGLAAALGVEDRAIEPHRSRRLPR